MPVAGPSIPPCINVPKGTETIAFEYHEKGVSVVFLDSAGKKITTQKPQVIALSVTAEVTLAGRDSGGVRKARFSIDVENGCPPPEAYKKSIMESW